MSNLQILGRRCPVMGKALAVQSTRSGSPGLGGVFGGTRAYNAKANLHTTRAQKAIPTEHAIRSEQPRK